MERHRSVAGTSLPAHLPRARGSGFQQLFRARVGGLRLKLPAAGSWSKAPAASEDRDISSQPRVAPPLTPTTSEFLAKGARNSTSVSRLPLQGRLGALTSKPCEMSKGTIRRQILGVVAAPWISRTRGTGMCAFSASSAGSPAQTGSLTLRRTLPPALSPSSAQPRDSPCRSHRCNHLEGGTRIPDRWLLSSWYGHIHLW